MRELLKCKSVRHNMKYYYSYLQRKQGLIIVNSHKYFAYYQLFAENWICELCAKGRVTVSLKREEQRELRIIIVDIIAPFVVVIILFTVLSTSPPLSTRPSTSSLSSSFPLWNWGGSLEMRWWVYFCQLAWSKFCFQYVYADSFLANGINFPFTL